MKKYLGYLSLVLILTCCNPSINTKPNKIPERAKINYDVDLNNYKGAFLVAHNTSSNQVYITLNENGDGIIAFSNSIKRLFKNVPTGITFPVSTLFGLSKIYLDKNGNGIIAWYQLSNTNVPESVPKTYLRMMVINDYTPEGEPMIIAETSNLSLFKDSYSLDIKLDDNGKGMILWSKNGSEKTEKLIPLNDAYSANIDNYKIISSTIRKTNSQDLVQVIKKDKDNYSIINLPLTNADINGLANTPNLDDKGNGTIAWLENRPRIPEVPEVINGSISGGVSFGSNIFPAQSVMTNLYIQKVLNYKLAGDKILLQSLSNAYTKIDENGNGAIVSSEYEKFPSAMYLTGFKTIYYSIVKNFIVGEKQKVSDYRNSIYPVIDFNSKGNGLIAWLEVPGAVYARRIENFELQ